MRTEPSSVPNGGCNHYIDLTDREDISSHCPSYIFDVDDNISMNILREFIRWYECDEIEMNMLEDEYEKFCNDVDFTKIKIMKEVK